VIQQPGPKKTDGLGLGAVPLPEPRQHDFRVAALAVPRFSAEPLRRNESSSPTTAGFCQVTASRSRTSPAIMSTRADNSVTALVYRWSNLSASISPAR